MSVTSSQLEQDRLERVREWLRDHDWSEVTAEQLAHAAGVSRMTLYRRGIDKAAVLSQLRDHLENEYREAVLPALVSSAPAAERLEMALHAHCEVDERYLHLLDALGRAGEFVFHEQGDGPVMTRVSFTDGVRRILEDGNRDGSLHAPDVDQLATLLFNTIGWTYRHMRTGHRWPPELARERLVALLLHGVARPAVAAVEGLR